ncbi:ComEC/Rec2 family competence protein [Myxococcus virescens]|uniref:ComEC/Rec2 family competence protein n=1 Tax=Myxococcus virescens TaxID=83456 RepID=UPI003DA65DB8
MMKLEMLPAGRGDCLILEYGTEGRRHRVLIDGGMPGTAKALRSRLRDTPQPHFELVVVTHVDLDHIGGILKILQDPARPFTFGDLWFNGYGQMRPFLADTLGEGHGPDFREAGGSPQDLLGPAQGEALAKLVRDGPWNEAFGHKALVVPDAGELPRVILPGGLSLTLLSPTPNTLRKMAGVWKKEVEAVEEQFVQEELVGARSMADLLGGELDVEELANQREELDEAEANGSSIALLAEYEGRSLLLGADAWPQVLVPSLQRLLKQRGQQRLTVSAVQVPHHGSKKNLTKQLLALLDTERFLISTDGSRFKHPDPVSVARIVNHRRGVKLYFNVRSDFTTPWASPLLQGRHGFAATYPSSGASLVVDL